MTAAAETTAIRTTAAPRADFRRLMRSALSGGEAPAHPVLVALGALALLASVVLRFWAPSALWLDEALSVNIARLPVTQIPHALSHDGAPPLYYVLLHYWMLVFGQGDFAVRALSGLVSVVTIPFLWVAGRRVGGQTVAWAALFLGVTSPFAINYATDTRMYSMMVLWSVLGFLALARVLEAPSRGRLVALGAVTAAMLYTHYWGLYLVGVTGLWLLWHAWRESRGPGAVRPGAVRPALRAVVAGGVLWLPWLPVFVYQALHTGTPWTGAAGPADVLGVFRDFAGTGPWGALGMFALFALFALGVFGRRAAAGTVVETVGNDDRIRRGVAGPAVVIELRPRRHLRPLVGIIVATLGVAVVLSAVANTAFVARYTAVVLPLFLLVVAAGVGIIPGRRVQVACLAVVCLAGILTGYGENSQQRTQAVQVAAVLNVQAQPGDVVVYCPDQLGPAVDRLLRVPGVTELTFPRAIGPQRVDWVDYRTVIARTDVGGFAQQMLSRLGANHTLWLVWRNGYPGLAGDCGYLRSWLNLLRPTGVTLVHQHSGKFYEYENLVRYPN